MKKIFIQVFLSLALLCVTLPVNAQYIVDTGTPSTPPPDNYALMSNQWLAGEFHLDQPSLITGFEGFMKGVGSLQAILYGDGGDVPDVTNEIYSAGININTNGIFSWQGLSGLNLNLSSGSYWAAFEIRESQNFLGSMASGAPAPLSNYAGTNPSTYFGADYINVGIRVQGAPVAPEPISSTLFIVGGATLGFRRWRKERQGK